MPLRPPPPSRTIRVTSTGGITLHAESTGSGPAIVFVHEFAGDHRSWEPQVRHFSRSNRCITFSARGYPPSEVPADAGAYGQDLAVADVVSVMDQCEVDRAHVVGHSMGAYTALHVGLRHPGRCISVTAAGCGWGSSPADAATVQESCARIADLFEREPIADAAWQYAHAPMRLTFKAKDPRGFTEFAAMLADHSSLGSAMTMRYVQARRPSLLEMVPDLRQFRPPLLVLVGDEDFPCLDGSLLLKRTVPTAALFVVPRAGHTITTEEPAVMNAALAELFAASAAGTWMAHRQTPATP